MSGIFATAGSRVYIGGPLAAKTTDFQLSDFTPQSWVNIGWLETIGQFGDESASVTFTAIGENRVQKLKGARDAGTMNLVCGIDPTDEGQQSLKLAEKTPNSYAFKVVFNDAPAGGTPSERYFIAQVMSAREQLDGANNVMKMNANLGINSNVVEVPASA